MPLFRRKKQAQRLDDQALITYLPLSSDEFGTDEEREAVFALESRLEAAVAALGGEHDGNEFGEGQAILYTYGPDADALLSALRASFADFPVRAGAYSVKRYGRADDPEAREERVTLR
ncbi:MAG: hypothetical protein M3R12_08595 [Actinomycetota bacterium]|nr:hypothetical protein [Actinomycetota bacterium]